MAFAALVVKVPRRRLAMARAVVTTLCALRLHRLAQRLIPAFVWWACLGLRVTTADAPK